MHGLPEYINQMLHSIAENEKFRDYSITLKAEGDNDGGISGVLFPVEITGTREIDGNVQQSALSLLCKTPPHDVKRLRNFKTFIAFAREVYVYENLLPEYKKFQEEKGLLPDASFISYPKCYASRADSDKKEYVIILEDLAIQGYSMWKNKIPMPLENLQWALIELGKFHGTGFALKDQKPEIYKKYMELYDIHLSTMKAEKSDILLPYAIERVTNILEDEKQRELFKLIREKYISLIDSRTGNGAAEKFGVVNHGDFWNNNIMFQYGENFQGKKIESVKFIDWQLARYCSPVCDFLFNVFTTTNKEMRDKHFTDFMKVYYLSLSTTIQTLGSDPKKLFSFKNFEEELQKHGVLFLMYAPMALQFVIAEPDDLYDMKEYNRRISNGESINLVKDFKGEKQAEYIQAARDVVNDLFAYGFVTSK